jgi:hypothetical protein
MEIHDLKLYDTLQIRFLLYDFLDWNATPRINK